MSFVGFGIAAAGVLALHTKNTNVAGTSAQTATIQFEETGTCSAKHDNCMYTGCCQNSDWKCYKKDAYWAECKRSCEDGVATGDDEDNAQEDWACDVVKKHSSSSGGSGDST